MAVNHRHEANRLSSGRTHLLGADVDFVAGVARHGATVAARAHRWHNRIRIVSISLLSIEFDAAVWWGNSVALRDLIDEHTT